MDELYTWTTIGTLAGAAMMTYLIVAYTKGLRWIRDMSTDLYAVIVATVVLLAAMGAQGQLIGWAPWVLALFNGFLVAAAAGKVNDKALAEYDKQSVYYYTKQTETDKPLTTPPPKTGTPGNNSPGKDSEEQCLGNGKSGFFNTDGM